MENFSNDQPVETKNAAASDQAASNLLSDAQVKCSVAIIDTGVDSKPASATDENGSGTHVAGIAAEGAKPACDQAKTADPLTGIQIIDTGVGLREEKLIPIQLRDHKKAIIVGEETYGKGSWQGAVPDQDLKIDDFKFDFEKSNPRR